MELEGLLQQSQEPATCPYPEPYQASPKKKHETPETGLQNQRHGKPSSIQAANSS
jgi:hypothetical protein